MVRVNIRTRTRGRGTAVVPSFVREGRVKIALAADDPAPILPLMPDWKALNAARATASPEIPCATCRVPFKRRWMSEKYCEKCREAGIVLRRCKVDGHLFATPKRFAEVCPMHLLIRCTTCPALFRKKRPGERRCPHCRRPRRLWREVRRAIARAR